MLTDCIRNLFAWLARRHVSKGRSNSHGVVTQKPECGIAAGAEKAAHGASLMVVIYSQALLYACASLGYAQTLADRAASALSFKHRVVLGWLNAKTFLAASIRAKSVVLLAIIGAPLAARTDPAGSGMPRRSAQRPAPCRALSVDAPSPCLPLPDRL